MNFVYSKPRWNNLMMELANRAVNFNINCSALHLIVIVVIYQMHSVYCGIFPSSLTAKTYNTSNGTLCYMCSPGQFKVGDCIRPGEVALCKPCANGSFQTVQNVAVSCQLCTKVCTQHNQELIEVCNSTTDNICQCSSGYFKLNYEGFCKKHKMCAPGEWVKSPGNKDRDTICESCIEGKTFSINGSATEGCLPCTRCDVKGLYEMTPCTIKSDAQCVTYRPPDGSHNIGAIVGGTLGPLIAVFIFVAIVWFYKRHQRNLQSPEDDAERNEFIKKPDPVTLNGIRLQVLRKLSTDLISIGWKFFFRELLVDDNQIQQVEHDHRQSVQEQIYQLLLYLNQKGTLTKRSIINAFEALDKNDLAVKYSEEEFPDC